MTTRSEQRQRAVVEKFTALYKALSALPQGSFDIVEPAVSALLRASRKRKNEVEAAQQLNRRVRTLPARCLLKIDAPLRELYSAMRARSTAEADAFITAQRNVKIAVERIMPPRQMAQKPRK